MNFTETEVGTKTIPMAHSYRLGLVTWTYQVRIPVGPGICHCGFAYIVLQTVQRHGVYSAVYGTVGLHYKEPLKSFRNKSRAWYKPWASFCRDIASLCRKRRKTILTKTNRGAFKQYNRWSSFYTQTITVVQRPIAMTVYFLK